jgi:hypothetical protein
MSRREWLRRERMMRRRGRMKGRVNAILHFLHTGKLSLIKLRRKRRMRPTLCGVEEVRRMRFTL